MDPATIGLLAGLGIGALKGQQNTKKNAEQDKYRKVAMAYSPWTGMGDVGGGTEDDVLSSAISGGAMGASMGNTFKTSPQDRYYNAMAGNLENKLNPGAAAEALAPVVDYTPPVSLGDTPSDLGAEYAPNVGTYAQDFGKQYGNYSAMPISPTAGILGGPDPIVIDPQLGQQMPAEELPVIMQGRGKKKTLPMKRYLNMRVGGASGEF